jgi:hypothetical protein
MCSNIPASHAYGVYISQLIRYARASSNYSDFLKRHLHLRNRLLDQGYVESDFKAPNLPFSLRSKVPAVTVTVFKFRNKIGKIVVKAVPYSVT